MVKVKIYIDALLRTLLAIRCNAQKYAIVIWIELIRAKLKMEDFCADSAFEVITKFSKLHEVKKVKQIKKKLAMTKPR